MSKQAIFKRTAAVFASAAIALIAAVAPVAAEDAKPAVWLQISPVSNRVSLEAGQQLEYSFNVENIGSEAFTYRVYATPYSVTNGTYELNFANETPRTQIARWVTFKGADGNFASSVRYSIEPGEKQAIEYKVSVPEDVPAGGQYATIFAESDPSDSSESSGIKTVSRVGLVLYGRTNGQTDEQSEIHDLTLKSFLTKGHVNSTVTVKNYGNTDFEARYHLVVKSLFGKVVYDNSQDKTDVYDILPDTERNMEVEWKDTPVFGIFKAEASVTALGESQEMKKIILIMPIFVMILMLLLLTILIIWIIMILRKRRAQKSKLIV